MAEKLDISVIVYLDDIFVYIKDPKQGYVKAVWWVLEVFRKYSLYTKMKKYWFY